MGLEFAELRRKSHLLVRIAPESMQGTIDFVELCGSDLAASGEVASSSREVDRDRRFASESFNSLSQAMIA